MNNAVRRRLAMGSAVTAGALVAGLLIAPSASARPEGLSITPAGAENTGPATLTFNTTDAQLQFGGDALFTRVGSPSATFTVAIDDVSSTMQAPTADRSQPGTVDLSDVDGNATAGNRVGIDGPADAGTYAVSATGTSVGIPPLATGGGNDTCSGCFTVLAPSGPVVVSSVAPTSLRPGATANVSVVGNNFERGSRIEVLKADGTVDTAITTNRPPVNGQGNALTDGITLRTELNRQWILGPDAVPGARNVRVTNLDGRSAVCNACFSVAGPSLTAVAPITSGANDPGQGDVALTFRGTSVVNGEMTLEPLFTPGSSTRQALTLRETTPTTSTSNGSEITGTFNLSDAAPGTYQPVVRGADGTVNAGDTARFTVLQRNDRLPTITRVSRTGTTTAASQAQGTTGQYDVVGTNFSKGAVVTVSGTGVTTTAVEFVNASLLRATFQTTGTAATGARNVTVTLTDGKTDSETGAFTVTAGQAGGTPTPTPSASPSSTATATVSSRYVGLPSPVRVLDTRANNGRPRTGAITLDLSGQITDPNATAAVLNVTVTNGNRRGFLVAYPAGTTKPGTSNVNFEGQRAATRTTPATAGTQANEVVVRLPADRRVTLFVDSASAHVIADLVGSFTSSNAGGRVITQSPVRALDTRNTDQQRRRGEVVLDLRDRLPATATAAILNVTVTGTSARGFVTVYPTGTQRPGTSNVNFDAGQTRANEVTTQVGTGANQGRVSLFIDSAQASLVVDVVGAVTERPAGGTQVFTPLASPQRAIDTRDNRGARVNGNLTVQMPSSVPSNATGVVLNVTATNGTRSGFVTIFPTGQQNPGTSNVNFPTNLTQANEVITGLGSNRSVTAFVGGSGSPAAHVIVDVVGYLTPQAAPAASASPSASSGPGIPGLPLPG